MAMDYAVALDFTASASDILLDQSINCTAASAMTLPDATEAVELLRGVRITNSGAETLTIKKPDTSTLVALTTLTWTTVFVYIDASGVPQWSDTGAVAL